MTANLQHYAIDCYHSSKIVSFFIAISQMLGSEADEVHDASSEEDAGVLELLV